MPLVALMGWAETRSLEMKSPKLVVGMQTRGPQPAAYQVHISRKLDEKQTEDSTQVL